MSPEIHLRVCIDGLCGCAPDARRESESFPEDCFQFCFLRAYSRVSSSDPVTTHETNSICP